MARPRRRNWCTRLRATERDSGCPGRTGRERDGATWLTLPVGLPKRARAPSLARMAHRAPAKVTPFAGEPDSVDGLACRKGAVASDLFAGKSHAFCRRARTRLIGWPAEAGAA